MFSALWLCRPFFYRTCAGHDGAAKIITLGLWSVGSEFRKAKRNWAYTIGPQPFSLEVCIYLHQKAKSRQHPDFPGGHPPEYYPSLRLLNFAERTGYGVLSLRWPSTTLYCHQPHQLPSQMHRLFHQKRTISNFCPLLGPAGRPHVLESALPTLPPRETNQIKDCASRSLPT